MDWRLKFDLIYTDMMALSNSETHNTLGWRLKSHSKTLTFGSANATRFRSILVAKKVVDATATADGTRPNALLNMA